MMIFGLGLMYFLVEILVKIDRIAQIKVGKRMVRVTVTPRQKKSPNSNKNFFKSI